MTTDPIERHYIGAYVDDYQRTDGACTEAHYLTARRIAAEAARRVRAEAVPVTVGGGAPSNAELDIHAAPTPVTLPPRKPALDLGLWIDDRPAAVLEPAYLERLRGLGLSHVAVMVERSGGGWDPTWSIAQLRQLRAALPMHERVLTIWPQPAPTYLDDLSAALPAMVSALGTRTIEVDTEGHWKAKHRVGYRTLADAGRALMTVLREHVETVELTTFPLHTEASGPGSIRGEDRLYVQTYAIASKRGEGRTWAGRMGPVRRAEEDVRRAFAKTRGEGLDIGAGLAAWAQDGWPGEPHEAMAEAVESAKRGGVRRIRWWSSKWVVGGKRTSYGASAVRDAVRAARVGPAQR